MDALALNTDAGHRLLARYRRMQNSRDLNQSINHFECALDLCPMDHPYHPAVLFNLATTEFVSCQANRTYFDLDIPISLFQGAFYLRPTDHPDRTITQLHLAIALLSRFAKRGFQTDADAARELLSEVLDVCHANSHIYRAALTAIETSALHSAGSIDANNLGGVHFERQGNDEDLDQAIAFQMKALALHPVGHTDRSMSLYNLAIALHREVLALRPVGHTDRSSSLNNLANRLASRFEHRGNDEDLDQAIALHREALALRLVGHTYRSMSLNNLANRLASCFDHRGNREDLDKS
ncbi:hypothetical protein F4604DRAFT_1919733 [Suillus subluteus]|nr:hypothetical protein F4604DRAFT_1919733 [Suillus subluteus]